MEIGKTAGGEGAVKREHCIHIDCCLLWCSKKRTSHRGAAAEGGLKGLVSKRQLVLCSHGLQWRSVRPYLLLVGLVCPCRLDKPVKVEPGSTGELQDPTL